MKAMLLAAAAVIVAMSGAQAQYGTRNNGSSYGGGFGTGSNSNSHYVAPHYNPNTGSMTRGYRATNPNSTQMDNYGTRGNVNPYTGAVGTRTPRY